MALKVLMLRKQRDQLKKALDAELAKREGFTAREAELETAINELTEESTDEERSAVDEAVNAFEAEKRETEEKISDLETKVTDIEKDIADEEEKQEAPTEPEPTKEAEVEESRAKDQKGMVRSMNKRNLFAKMDETKVRTMFEREDVKKIIGQVRKALEEKRSISGAELTIPDVWLGMIRENIENYSKLYARVTIKNLSGRGRETIMGTIPEGVWTECCANLNELLLAFNEVEVDCYKVGGFFEICNATLEDSDIDLASELLTAIGQAIGYALDKAIVYGLGTRMPLGFVTRLAQTSEPSDYPETYRPWVDLHTSNIKKINKTGVELFQQILLDGAAAKGKYSRGQRTWIMNDTTYTKLKAEGLGVNAAGAIVTGVNGTMPVAGGDVVVLEFMADGDIAYGYLDLYLLGERRAITLGSSEHFKFLADKTVFKGTARYDGLPVIAEAFGLMNINNVNPTTSVQFAADTANADSE